MRLYFMRHADAEDGMDDFNRPLSVRGRKEVECIGHFLKTAGIYFDHIHHSPLVRARQTAEQLQSFLQTEKVGLLHETDALRNETTSVSFNKWLGELRGDDILLVGHAPSIANRARKILEIHSSHALEMPKAGLLALDYRATGSSLLFFVNPQNLGLIMRHGC